MPHSFPQEKQKSGKGFCYGNGLTKKTFGATTYIVLGLRYNSHEIKLKEYVKLDYARTNLFDQMVSCHSFFCWKEFKGRLYRTGERTLLSYQKTYRFTSLILPLNHFYWWYYRSTIPRIVFTYLISLNSINDPHFRKDLL